MNPEKAEIKTVGFFKLFRFATKLDYMLMAVGTIVAALNKVAQPLLAQFIGNTRNQFSSDEDSSLIIENARNQCIYMVIIGIGSFFCGWLIQYQSNYSGKQQYIQINIQYSQINQSILNFFTFLLNYLLTSLDPAVNQGLALLWID
ncbi:hypothetical protein ABPG72_014498 [Tetrahymena utriculariae]